MQKLTTTWNTPTRSDIVRGAVIHGLPAMEKEAAAVSEAHQTVLALVPAESEHKGKRKPK